jgi:hypothetical protein
MTDFEKELEALRIPKEKRGKGKVIFHDDYDPKRTAKFIADSQGLRARIEYARRVSFAVAAVREYLKCNGRSQRWLAKQMHMREQQIGQILKSGRMLEGETLTKLMIVTGVDVFAVMAQPELDKRAENCLPINASVGVVLKQAAYRQQVASFTYNSDSNAGNDPTTKQFSWLVPANTYLYDTPYRSAS